VQKSAGRKVQNLPRVSLAGVRDMLSDEEWFDMRNKDRRGIAISQVAREQGVNWRTAKKYMMSPNPPQYKARNSSDSILDPHKEYIKELLDQHPFTSKRILEKIRERGYTGSYTLVKDFVYPIKKDRPIPAEMRFETRPGEQAQTDWFDFGHIEVDGIRRKLWAFSKILGYSRTRYLEFVLDCKTTTFIQCHLNAFAYFGGYTETELYDNTKNVVLTRMLKSSDSIWNPLFMDFATYYGITPRLCKPGRGQTKGKIERTGRFIREDFFMGLDFDSHLELNSLSLGWCNKVNSLEHATTHEIPFERLKHENLRSLYAIAPYQIVLTEMRKVSRDCFVSYAGNKYSVPWRHAGREAKLLIKDDKFDVQIGGDTVCTHDILVGSHRTTKVKEHFDGLYKAILDRNKETHLRRIQGNASRKEPLKLLPGTDVDVQKRNLAVYDQLIPDGDRI
jgi:transposase